MGKSAPIAAFALTLGLAACSGQPAKVEPAHTFDLSEVVSFQGHQLSTDLISMPEGLALDRAVHGWWREAAPERSESCFRLASTMGQFELFSADGDLTAVDIELKGDGSKRRQTRVQVRFNGHRFARFEPPSDWSRMRFELPRERVRRGINLLEIVQRDSTAGKRRKRPRKVCVRRLRAESATDRPLWPTRPTTISTADDETGAAGPSTIRMPVAGFLDVAFTVPAEAHLEGAYSFEPHPSPSKRPIYLYIQSLDDDGAERTLIHRRLYKRLEKAVDFRLDLSEWAGRPLRLRVGATGPGNGTVHWHGLRIAAREPVAGLDSLPPITRQRPNSSGDLGRPDILVVLLDAARADGFSVFGGRAETPAAARLAAAGAAFTNAVSPSPWTGQSVPAIMTGLFPDTLGVGPWGSRLPDEVPTLAELLGAAGYRTVLWSQHPFYSNHESFRRGFEEFHRSPRGTYDVLPTVDELVANDRPTFAFVHLIPPHAPYEPPAPFRGAYSGWYRGEMTVDAKTLNSFPRRRDPAELSEEDRRYVFDRYLENVAFADHLVGKLLAMLDRAGRYDNSLIVLLSDHGEAFLEHGRYLHTSSVHREMLHVPLILKWPETMAEPASRVTEPVSLVDLVPTLADGLALQGIAEGFQGRSLMPDAPLSRSVGRPIYAMTRGLHDPARPPNTRLMLELSGWRALVDVAGGQVKLYDVRTDTLEARDLAAEHPLEALRLRQAAQAQWFSNRRQLGAELESESVEPLDPEVEEQLRALGYLN